MLNNNSKGIVISLEKTLLQKVFAIITLISSILIALYLIYNCPLYNNWSFDFGGRFFVFIASVGILISITELILPNKVILQNDTIHFVNCSFLYRRYRYNKIDFISSLDHDDVNVWELLSSRCDLDDKLCIVQTEHMPIFINVKDKADIKKMELWLDNCKEIRTEDS